MATLREITKYLKRNDKNLYNEYKDCITTPIMLVNRLVRHYQWIFEIKDFSHLDLQDRLNKNYLNLFLYGMENDEELASNFVNYLVFSLRNAFDFEKRIWNLDLIFNIFIHHASEHEFNLFAMYVLLASTYDRSIKFVLNLQINNKLQMELKEVLDLFELIIDQNFYDELKHEITLKRKHSFYHKEPAIDIKLPPTTEQLAKMKELAILKKAQAIAEKEFKQWDIAKETKKNKLNEIANDSFNVSNDNNANDNEQTFLNHDNEVTQEENKPKFAPNPNIKIIKLKAFDL